jgi:hypothetical protein
MKTTGLVASWSFTSNLICLGFMVKKVTVLIMISAILKISQLIIIRVIHSIFKPVPINKKKVRTHAVKAINNLLAAGMRLKRFVFVLFFSKAIFCGANFYTKNKEQEFSLLIFSVLT